MSVGIEITSEAPRTGIVTMGCRSSKVGEIWPWHAHDYDEVCLFSDAPTTLLVEGEELPMRENSVYVMFAGERHGFRNEDRNQPRIWAIHYHPRPGFYDGLPIRDWPWRKRVWCITREQAASFQSLFSRLSAENVNDLPCKSEAVDSLLRLIHVSLIRWRESAAQHGPVVRPDDPEVLAVWQMIHSALAHGSSDIRFQDECPNYDSVRHKFRRCYGISPRDMLTRLKIERAKILLADPGLSIKEIGSRLGYLHHNDFTRAFVREVGVTPSHWRINQRKFTDPADNELRSP
ncbi:MAG: AraC family transcriptional regulator [Fimbriimonadales bacterium]|nr:AraC family transcriptional regulator [Fimbriimonadales bacterium]